jgi:hypothetical protein
LSGWRGQDAERPGSCDERAEEVRKHDAARDVNDDEGVEKDDAIEVHVHVPRQVKLLAMVCSELLPFGRLWYAESNTVVKFYLGWRARQ